MLPARAVTSAGGYVDDAGEVAGITEDGGNVKHGLTWLNGTYTVFDLPQAARPYGATLSGINGGWRVVGGYTSQAGAKTHAFLTWPSGDGFRPHE